jgi:hypothetical protein
VLIYAVCVVGLLVGLAVPRWAAAEKWGPFRGQVLDVETGQPIAGAAVLVTWWEDVPNPVQGQEKFYDAREAETDAEGRFEVPRLSPPFFGFRILPPRFTFFAPGYKHVGTVVTPQEGEFFMAPTVAQMRRMQTREERVEYQGLFPPSVPFEKLPKLLAALNRERRSLGFKPFGK